MDSDRDDFLICRLAVSSCCWMEGMVCQNDVQFLCKKTLEEARKYHHHVGVGVQFSPFGIEDKTYR